MTSKPQHITMAVEEADAVDVLLELNRLPGVDARFGETKPTVEESTDHSLYYLDYGTLVPLAIGMTTSLTTLATALMNFVKTKASKAQAEGAPPPAPVTIYIDDQKIEITTADSTASIQIKLSSAGVDKPAV